MLTSSQTQVLGLPVALGELWTVMQEVDLGPELNPLCTEAEMVKQWSKGDFLSSNVVKLPVPMMRPVQTFNQNFFFDLLTANESNSTAWIDPNWQYYPTSLGTNPEICLLDGTSARTGKNRKRDRLRSRMHSQRTRGPAGEDLTAEKDEFHLPPGFVVMMYSPKFGDGSEKTHKYEVPDLPYRDTVVPGLSKKECKTLKRNYTDAMVALVTPKRRKNPKFGGGGGGGGGNSKTTSTSTPSKKKASTASPAPATSSSTSAKNQNEQEEDKEAELSPEAGGAPQPLLANGNVNPEFSEYVDAMEIRGVITMEFSSTVRWMCPNAVVRKIANKITNDVTIALGELHRNFATSEFGYRQREKDSAAQLLNEMRSRAAVFNAKNEG
ncbi:unnamed protein product [Amoebophrya sp. A120]|nr:unnamed protein product [Amoebophrya sp. A120]|eukprot:GSA120T00000411001.1